MYRRPSVQACTVRNHFAFAYLQLLTPVATTFFILACTISSLTAVSGQITGVPGESMLLLVWCSSRARKAPSGKGCCCSLSETAVVVLLLNLLVMWLRAGGPNDASMNALYVPWCYTWSLCKAASLWKTATENFSLMTQSHLVLRCWLRFLHAHVLGH